MEIIYTEPPNFNEICKVIPEAKDHAGALFTYGKNIYAPKLKAGEAVTPHVNVHEEVHMMQQQRLEGGAKEWWEKWLTDKQFRAEQELEAYRAQYAFMRTLHGAKALETTHQGMHESFLMQLASDLSGPLYGHLMEYGAAEIKIKRI